MTKLQWIPLKEQRAKSKVTTLFKAINGQTILPIDDFEMRTSGRTRSGTHIFKLPQSNVDCHLYSYFPSTIRLWNNLPITTKLSSSTEDFKKQLENITLKAAY